MTNEIASRLLDDIEELLKQNLKTRLIQISYEKKLKEKIEQYKKTTK